MQRVPAFGYNVGFFSGKPETEAERFEADRAFFLIVSVIPTGDDG